MPVVVSILALVFCLSLPLSAKTLYVDGTTGNDTVTWAANGPASPWRTIGRAAWGNANRSAPNASQAAQPGDIVLITTGTYVSSLNTGTGRWDILYNPVNNGSAALPIAFQASGPVSIEAPSWGGPVIGAMGRNYIHWTGPFRIDEATILTAPDTGPVVLGGGSTGSGIDGATIRGAGGLWADNHNGIRIETCAGCFVRNARISNFYSLQNPDLSSHNGSCITLYGSIDTILEHNELFQCAAGIYMKGTVLAYGHYPQANITVRFNVIRDLLNIGVLIINNANGRIYQNVIYNTPQGIGFYDEAGIQFVNNTIYNAAGNGVSIKTAGHTGIVVQNQISAALGNGFYSDSASAPGSMTSNRNVWFQLSRPFAYLAGTNYSYSQWQSGWNQDLNSSSADPQFVNVASYDFRLQTASPARTLGIDILDLDNDGSTTDTIPAGAFVTGTEIIGPRSGSATAPSSACDLNSSGSVNVTDVQLCSNQAIGLASCAGGDIDQNGACNVIDVQRVVNAALGGTCVTQ